MFGWFRKPQDDPAPAAGAGARRVAEVGWLLDDVKAQFIYGAPEPVPTGKREDSSSKSLLRCPALVDYEARYFQVPCPIDLQVELTRDDQGRLGFRNLMGRQSPVTPKHLNQLLHITGTDQWRRQDRPVIQVSTPYRFVTDDEVWINQMPPVLDFKRHPWPGIFIGGRFALRSWPRTLMWAFEWCDMSKPLILRRGEPWFYVRFEPDHPSKAVRLVEAEWTPELRDFVKGLDAVTNYVNQTQSLFKVAEERRPEKLLKRRDPRHGTGAGAPPMDSTPHGS